MVRVTMAGAKTKVFRGVGDEAYAKLPCADNGDARGRRFPSSRRCREVSPFKLSWFVCSLAQLASFCGWWWSSAMRLSVLLQLGAASPGGVSLLEDSD
jgi:hypothetical protein